MFILFCGLAICTPKNENKDYQIKFIDKDNISLFQEPKKEYEESEQNYTIEILSDEVNDMMSEKNIQWKFKKHLVLANY